MYALHQQWEFQGRIQAPPADPPPHNLFETSLAIPKHGGDLLGPNGDGGGGGGGVIAWPKMPGGP